ncbi:MAG: glucose-6-phosphate isomerase, partial [Rhodospirillaceae bacterium]|nr:glucose-6-phosphate isomerase [Rhodospirillaceae bacterium]
MAPITETPEWKMLLAHRDEIEPLTLSDHFNADAGRFETLSFEVDGLVLDLSKNRLNAKTVELLVALADAAGLEARRDALFAGDNINETEARQALHPALRDRSELTGGG